MTATDHRAASKPRVLCVDDEPLVLEGLHDVLRRSFEVRAATSGAEGLERLRDAPHAFAIVISDMRMPAMGGAEFLRSARLLAPNTIRILLTGHADLDAAIRAVNAASLFRFLTKPCDPEDLLQACAAALGQHQLQTAERVLLEQTLRGSIDALTEVLALANPAAFGRAGRIKELVSKLADALALALEDRWEVEVAAMLADVGAVTLPHTTASKLYAGAPLTAQETEMARRVPVVTRQLLGKIPRLEGVLEILQRFRYDADAVTPGRLSAVPSGARMLRIATDFAELESRGSRDRGARRNARPHDL